MLWEEIKMTDREKMPFRIEQAAIDILEGRSDGIGQELESLMPHPFI